MIMKAAVFAKNPSTRHTDLKSKFAVCKPVASALTIDHHHHHQKMGDDCSPKTGSLYATISTIHPRVKNCQTRPGASGPIQSVQPLEIN